MTTIKLNPKHKGTYTGQPAKLLVAAELSSGRKLYAIHTAGGCLATEYDSSAGLRKFAAERYLKLEVE